MLSPSSRFVRIAASSRLGLSIPANTSAAILNKMSGLHFLVCVYLCRHLGNEEALPDERLAVTAHPVRNPHPVLRRAVADFALSHPSTSPHTPAPVPRSPSRRTLRGQRRGSLSR